MPTSPQHDDTMTPALADGPGTTGPLHGIRVLDLTSIVLGPLATQVLGDHGADVVKVETAEGDLVRANGVSRHAGMSSIFLAINRNKRSIVLDLKRAQGRALFLELAAGADVVVHNMRVQAMERLGLGYEQVRAVNPQVVYCVATGFGQDGPDRDKPAFDDIVQAACGLAALQAGADGVPAYVPSLVADKTAGLALANAILAALVHKARTGQGQQVEVPMFETLVAFNMAEHLGGLAFEPPTAPAGYGRILAGGRRPLPTADGHVAILPYVAQQWQRLFAQVGEAARLQAFDLADRYRVNQVVRALYGQLAELTPRRSTAEWIAVCEALDIPATRIYALDDLPAHPHLQAVGLFQTAQHPSEGTVRYVRPTARFGRTPASVRRQAPRVGQHTAAVLAELGYTAEQVATFMAPGGVAATG